MNLIGRLFGSVETDETHDTPPEKPDPYAEQQEATETRYEATVAYQNGDTETFECYGIERKTGRYITFNVDPEARIRRLSRFPTVEYEFKKRLESYEVLAREPDLEELAVDRFTLEWEVDYTLLNSRYNQEWKGQIKNMDLTIERDIE